MAFRVHWVAPIVWVVGGVSLREGDLGLSSVLAAALVYLAHSFGHWAFARLHRLPVKSLDIDGFGASIRYSGRAPRGVHAQVAFGGVLAHGVLAVLLSMAPAPEGMVSRMVWLNAVLGLVNLLPLSTLDGAKGWGHAMAALRQPVRLPHSASDHPAIRAQQLVAEADREVGHPVRPARGGRADERPTPPSDGEEARALAAQVDAIMAVARADAKARREQGSKDEPE
jgi:Zn-dependent protease